MAYTWSSRLRIALTLALGLGGATAAQLGAQTASSRLSGDWHSSSSVALGGSALSLSSSAERFGNASAQTQLERMLLLLEPSATQQSALTALLTAQQTKGSASYHQWLTATQFADRFANSASDVQSVADWLQAQGFSVAAIPSGRGWIEFSGTAAQVEAAFNTQVALASVNGSTRAYLTSGISVPTALAPLVKGLVSLDGSIATAALTTPKSVSTSVADLANTQNISTAEAITPKLAATLLGWTSIQSAGVTGAGTTIAIPTRSNLQSADVAAFRKSFGLKEAALTISPNGSDPGLTADQAEATVTASWAGAVAPAASIVVVPAATTKATDGLDLALAAAIDQRLGTSVAVGYANCETELSAAHQEFYAALYRQAAAEGISVVAATGDSGAAACHAAGSTEAVSTGLGVSALASTPWNTAVGASSFASASNRSTQAGWSQALATDASYAGGGGSSALYAAPSWQSNTGASKFTAAAAHTLASINSLATASANSHRTLPDLALPTAEDDATAPGLAFCMSTGSTGTGCTLMRTGGSAASAAIVAGIGSLLDQKYGKVGNLESGLYALEVESGVYTDVSTGSTAQSCTTGSTNCQSGTIGYSAATGYDLATGLGSVNTTALVNKWHADSTTVVTPTITIAISPTQTNATYNPAGTLKLTATVTDSTSAGVPLGNIIFSIWDTTGAEIWYTAQQSLVQLSGTNYSSQVSYTLYPVSTAVANSSTELGTFYIRAQYVPSDSTTYATTSVGGVSFTTSQTTTTTLATSGTPALGTLDTVWTLTATITPASSSPTPTGTVTFYDGTASIGSAGISCTTSTASSSTAATTTCTATMTASLAANIAHSITAKYSGDTYWNASSAGASVISASTISDTVTLTANYSTTNPAMPGTTVTLVATVTPSSSNSTETNPTGYVVFYNGTTQIGKVALTAVSNSYASTATLQLTSLPSGDDVITAVYLGDAYYSEGTSNAVTVAVEGFTLSASSTNPATWLTIPKGSAASASYVISPLGGYTGKVQIVCAVPSDIYMTCSPTPQDVDASTTSTVTFTITTYTTGKSSTTGALHMPKGSLWPQALGGGAMAALCLLILPPFRRRIPEQLRRFMVLVLLLVGVGSTGIGCTSSNLTTTAGTSLGQYTVTITASANINNTVVSQTQYLAVNVTAAN